MNMDPKSVTAHNGMDSRKPVLLTASMISCGSTVSDDIPSPDSFCNGRNNTLYNFKDTCHEFHSIHNQCSCNNKPKEQFEGLFWSFHILPACTGFD